MIPKTNPTVIRGRTKAQIRIWFFLGWVGVGGTRDGLFSQQEVRFQGQHFGNFTTVCEFDLFFQGKKGPEAPASSINSSMQCVQTKGIELKMQTPG